MALINAGVSSSGGGGTQYTSGATTPPTPIGTMQVFDNSGTIANVSIANPLPVSTTITGVSTAANQTNGTQQTKITNGTQAADTLAGDTGQNSLIMTGNRKEILYSVTANGVAFSQDVSNYRWISIQTITMGSGTLTFQGSNDNTNWSSVALQQPQNMSNVPAISTSSAGQLWAGPLQFRYFRGNVSGYTTGTIAGTVEFFSLPMQVLSPGGNVALTGTNGINVAQIAGTTTLVGNGVTGTGSQRVTIASDNTAFPISSISTSVTPGVAATNLGKAEDASHTSGDTGVFSLGVRNDNSATSFTNANGDYIPFGLDSKGRMIVIQKTATSTPTNVSTSTTSVNLLAANVERGGASIYNDSTAILYVKFGATASLTSFKVPLVAGAYYEVPAGYTGQIDGILSTSTGVARVCEEV